MLVAGVIGFPEITVLKVSSIKRLNIKLLTLLFRSSSLMSVFNLGSSKENDDDVDVDDGDVIQKQAAKMLTL